MKTKYYVHYVKECTARLRIFSSESAAIRFFNKMQKIDNENVDGWGDNWADYQRRVSSSK